MQLTFGDAEELGKRKRLRREIFLSEIRTEEQAPLTSSIESPFGRG
jgi:hypothetical protein